MQLYHNLQPINWLINGIISVSAYASGLTYANALESRRSPEELRERFAGLLGKGAWAVFIWQMTFGSKAGNVLLRKWSMTAHCQHDMARQARDQFFREATVLARLDHPNLPKVSDFFSIGGRDYLVMDYVPGKDLRTLMLEARQSGSFLAENEVMSWAKQLADASAICTVKNHRFYTVI